jgi:succinate dehydrogenase / fumarate reductase cytochrome b subunit
MAMNLVAIFSAEGYNMVCEFLGANWYALVASIALAGLVFIHFAYAILLTWQNRAARGRERYAVTDRPKTVEWASQNMFVLGLIVVLGLLLHLFNFWFNMQFAELMHTHLVAMGDQLITPHDGAAFIAYTFSKVWYVVLYLIWLAAIWFHLTHGFWSAFQTLGWNNKLWINRWHTTAYIYSSVLMGGFALVVVWFYVKSLL